MKIENKIKKILDLLGYHPCWLHYGFLTIEELNSQYILHKKATDDPNSKEANFYGYQHTEHLRYRMFLKITEEYTLFADDQLEKLIELVEIDEDKIMAKNFYRNIIQKKSITEEQIKKYHIKNKINN